MNEYLCLNITPGPVSSWELVHSFIGFQLFEEMPPYSLCLGCVKLFYGRRLSTITLHIL